LLVVVGLLAALPVAASEEVSAADPLTARGSLGQVQVWNATPGETVELWDGGDALVASGVADANGAYVFGVAPESTDDVPAGAGYTVHEGDEVSDAVDVFAYDFDDPSPPPQSFYEDQTLPVPANYGVVSPTDDDGYGYITMRDGTTLAANFMAPIQTLANDTDGPWPVIVNYSGYEPANPASGGDDPEITLLRAAGFAVVGVNLRGTGCSGGVYSYFERLQALDGYDVIEAIAAQPWVDVAPTTAQFGPGGPMVGMAGISFPGISQLFVGRTNPPSLAAMSPLSVIADSYRSILYPGGILNDGFATEWVADREASAEPAGQAWAQHRIDVVHDPICADNQTLKLQAPPLVARFAPDLSFEADPGDDLAPVSFVGDIDVPTFIAGAFQDEQTGGHGSTLLDEFQPATLKRAILYNGTHADALGPDVLRDLLEFLDVYVARRTPQANNILRGTAPAELAGTFGAPYAIAPRTAVFNRTQYENPAVQPKVVVRWERGARDSAFCQVAPTPPPLGQPPAVEDCDPATEGAGALFGRYESGYATWPPPATAARWYLQPDAGLGDLAPTTPDAGPRAVSSYEYTPDRSQETNYTGSSTAIWDKDATYHWGSPSEGTSLRYVSQPFDEARAFAGSGSVDLWVRADVDTDIEVTLAELRPGAPVNDGRETYIQSGWLRASHRAELPTSTALDVRRSYTAADRSDLPAGELVRARVELFPFAHIVRPGSRLALTISGPGGNRPFWRFAAAAAPADPMVDIGHSVGRPSLVTLPEVPLPAGAEGSTLPICGDLRSQPCRTVAGSTRPTAVDATLDPGDTTADLDRGVDLTWTAPRPGRRRGTTSVACRPASSTPTTTPPRGIASPSRWAHRPRRIGRSPSGVTANRRTRRPTSCRHTPTPTCLAPPGTSRRWTGSPPGTWPTGSPTAPSATGRR
jgi:predicted acyl esterase